MVLACSHKQMVQSEFIKRLTRLATRIRCSRLNRLCLTLQCNNSSTIRRSSERSSKLRMPVQQQQQQQQQPSNTATTSGCPDAGCKAVRWKDRNKWFGDDKIMTTAAYTIHQGLIEEEGFDPNTEEYYTEVDKRIRTEFPHKFQALKKSGGGSQVASAGNSASRSTLNQGAGRSSYRILK